MTADELKAALETLDVSPAAMARLLGVDVRTCRRWSSGAKPIPDTVATQIAAMVEAGGVTPQMTAEIQAAAIGDGQDVSRFLWVQVRDADPFWTVAEHDTVSDIYYLPGRLERYAAGDLVLGPAVAAPAALAPKEEKC